MLAYSDLEGLAKRWEQPLGTCDYSAMNLPPHNGWLSFLVQVGMQLTYF
jgi:hypothetical protein